MNDGRKSKRELLIELRRLRARVAELHQSEQKLQTFLQNSPTEILIVDRTYRIQFINRTWPHLTLQDVVGRSCLDFMAPDQGEILKKALDTVFHTGETVECEVYAGEKWYNDSIAPLRQDGKIIAAIINATDVSTRKADEEQLRFQAQLLDNVRESLVATDLEGKILYWGKGAEQLYLYTAAEVMGKCIDFIVEPQDRAQEVERMQHVLVHGSWSGQYWQRRKDGSRFWAETFISLVTDAAGKPCGFIGIDRDISDRKQLQDELERAHRLETAGRLAGQIAHDLNNLLGPLAAYPALIKEELARNHPALEMLEEMEFSAAKICEINQQLLALGRRGHYRMEPIDLNNLVHKVLMSMNLPDDLVVREEFAANLSLMKGGQAQVVRALLNLVGNAVEAMDGKGLLTVRTRNIFLEKPVPGYHNINRGEYVRLDISDTGCGIEPAIMSRIFDPFFTTKKMDGKSGTGLGLSVVHNILEDHHGYITVQNNRNRGTTFSLYFPVVRQEDTSKLAESLRGGNETILVADDDPVQRRVTSQLLQRLGYRVETVASGEESVRLVRKKPQDLLILDMVLGDIDGAEAYRRILEFRHNQKALIMSGFAMSRRVEEALKMGAGSFLTKPITLTSLATAVRNELDKT